MVFIPFCYAEAAANLLTNPQLDPFGKIPEYKFCAARVEKAGASPRRRSEIQCIALSIRPSDALLLHSVPSA